MIEVVGRDAFPGRETENEASELKNGRSIVRDSWLTRRASPRQKNRPASVTRNGGRLNLAIRKPWVAPKTKPNSSGNAIARSGWICVCDISHAAMMLVQPTIDPTDRSIPPVIITKVRP